MAMFENSSYAKRLSRLISWGHWFTFYNVIAAILLSSILIFSESSPETTLGIIYQYCYWFSHIAFLTFLCFVLTVFPLTLLFPYTRFIRGSASLIFTVALSVLLLDALTYIKLGYHLNQASTSKVVNILLSYINSDPIFFAVISGVIFLAILIYELVMSNFAWKRLSILKNKLIAKTTAGMLIGLFFVSHFIHIYADANLDFDILRQDTTLPFSYPTTAKTLLTKYDLFDREKYMQRKSSSIELKVETPEYPDFEIVAFGVKPKNAAILILRDQVISQEQTEKFSAQIENQQNVLPLNKHIDVSQFESSLFNLMYGLPTVYKQGILAQQKLPILFQGINHYELNSSLITISPQADFKQPNWFNGLFNTSSHVDSISALISQNYLASQEGLIVYSFNDISDYEFELFVNALLLAQLEKPVQDVIWIGSVSKNFDIEHSDTRSLIFNVPTNGSTPNSLSNHMDVLPTLMSNWFKGVIHTKEYSTGNSLNHLPEDRVIANTTSKGMAIFTKDMKVFIDNNGRMESYSTALDAPLNDDVSFSLVIDGVNYLKQYANQAQLSDK